jgi:ferredoxin
MSRRSQPLGRLRVDWPVCEGRGLCFELLPELITLDEWGFPIISGEVTADLADAAQRAVRACPRMAIRLVEPR